MLQTPIKCIQYATKENLKQPIGGVRIDVKEKDHYLGGDYDYSILQDNSSWLGVVQQMIDEGEDIFEFQRIADGRDLYWCITYASNSADKIIHKRKYGYSLDMDERYLAIGSGTKMYVGNSQQAVEDFKRKYGFLVENKNASEMTWAECWSSITSNEIKEGQDNLEFYSFSYKYLPRLHNGFSSLPYCSNDELYNALKRRPINVCVDGHYVMDEQNRIGGTTGNLGRIIDYTHAVLYLGDTFGKNGEILWRNVLDSETKQLLKFVPDYKFGYPYIKDIIKLNSMKLYKKKGESAIYFLNPKDNKLVPYADGVITGGDMFKILFGDYKFAPTQIVDELPYSVAGYQMTTK